MSARVLKWNVPVDDQPHPIGLGEVVLVACQYEVDIVQVWTLEPLGQDLKRQAQVVATGEPAPSGWIPAGSAVTAGGALVWHVFTDEHSRHP